ncbi:MAG: putative manganese transporter [Xanthomonadales bacterium]|nr:putative manganese transporter [Xanthomonadales bacterium]
MSSVIRQSLEISGFVFVMMLLIEYLNVYTKGLWRGRLVRNGWGQYLVAVLLGATPGCLGAFLVVGMYTHRLASMGALVAAMIATSGDEAFVMLALVPGQAVILILTLAVLGIVAGALTDRFHARNPDQCDELTVHDDEQCRCFRHGHVLAQLKEMSLARGALLTLLAGILLAVSGGYLEPGTWNWIQITILVLTALSIGIVATVPEHFLEEHLWNHVARKHLPRVFAWTLGTLLLLYLLTDFLHLDGLIHKGQWAVLLIAALVGLIPESGPHLVFLTLYAQGLVPLSILLASSIVQDGHGMLPLLAHSRRDFLYVKMINLTVGLGVGALALFLGY